MSNELMRYMQGDVQPSKRDREVAERAKSIYDEVRLAAFKADAPLVLAGHIMEGVKSLDNHRRELAKDDPVTNALLADIEQEALTQVKRIQRGLFNDWGL
jgi:hypothetical protein